MFKLYCKSFSVLVPYGLYSDNRRFSRHTSMFSLHTSYWYLCTCMGMHAVRLYLKKLLMLSKSLFLHFNTYCPNKIYTACTFDPQYCLKCLTIIIVGWKLLCHANDIRSLINVNAGNKSCHYRFFMLRVCEIAVILYSNYTHFYPFSWNL